MIYRKQKTISFIYMAFLVICLVNVNESQETLNDLDRTIGSNPDFIRLLNAG